MDDLKKQWCSNSHYNPSLLDKSVCSEKEVSFAFQQYIYVEKESFVRAILQMSSSKEMKYMNRPPTTIIGPVIIHHKNKKYLVYMDKESHMYPFEGSTTCIGIADLENNTWKGTATIDAIYMHSNQLFV
jgi:hypothetical protein